MKEVVLRQKTKREELIGKRYILREGFQNGRSHMNDSLILIPDRKGGGE